MVESLTANATFLLQVSDQRPVVLGEATKYPRGSKEKLAAKQTKLGARPCGG